MIRYVAVVREFGLPFRRVRALSGLDLTVRRGECVGVVGPNGSGKTTLLGLALGRLRPTAGTVAVEGRAPRAWVRRNGAGWLPERFRLPARWQVGRALLRLAILEGLPPADAVARASAAAELAGLAGQEHRRVGELSRGTAQRLGIAQLHLARRRLWVLDEPSSGLDPTWRIRFRELVEARRRAHPDLTVLLASHDIPEVERLADRTVILEAGRARPLPTLPEEGREWVIRAAGGIDPALFLPVVARRADRARIGPIGPEELRRALAAYLGAGGRLLELRPSLSPLERALRPGAGPDDEEAGSGAGGNGG